MERPIKELTEDEVKEYDSSKLKEEILCTDCKWYCTAIKNEPFCNLHKIEIIQSACFDGEKKSKTNAERIRAMSDEELADFLDSIIQDWNQGTAQIGDRIIDSWLDWLKEEVKDE